VYNALEACSVHLEQFGGHMYAAGMTLKAENYEAFKNAFEKVVQETMNPELRTPEMEIDAEIDFSEITPKLVRILKQFEPFGPQNMTPVFATQNVMDTGYPKYMGANEEHIRLFVKQQHSDGFAAIGFNLAHKKNVIDNRNPFQMAYCIDENEWNGQISLQLRLKDIQ
jgi:single-stranded-DNA-specific exonuclease